MSTMTTINDAALGTLSARLRAARLLAGLEQADIAQRLGVARTTVSTWEQGKTEPSATNFVRWAQVTGQPMEWLAEGCTPWDLNPEPTDSTLDAAFWAIVEPLAIAEVEA